MRTVRLQRHLNRSSKGKNYYKFVVVIPSATIELLKWSEVRDLNYHVKDQSLVLKPTNKNKHPT